MKHPLDRSERHAALKIIAIYSSFAALWIYLSDEALGLFIPDPAILVRISVFKGFLFIVVTAALLYQLIVRYIRKTMVIEEAREATIELLRICNKADSKQALMKELTLFFQNFTGCEAVGVRLKEGDDFPYYETRGFPTEFVLVENRLCSFDQSGEMVRDSVGNPVYDCMCGNIISGRFDPAKPFFTAHGSFWSSSTTELLATTTDEDRRAKTRNRCNGEGYESVALVPLRSGGETFGLFQFNDSRRGLFTADKISLYEDLVAYVAISLAKLIADEALLESGKFSSQIIDNAEEGIIVQDCDMRYQVWNPFMERLTGKAAGEVIGRLPLDIFPFLEDTGVIENVQKVLDGQQLASQEFVFQSPHTGLTHLISDTCVPLRNIKGDIIGIIGTVLDITERKQTEERQRKSEANFRRLSQEYHTLLDNMPDGILQIASDLKVIWANRSMMELIKADEMQVKGNFCYQALWDFNKPCDTCPVARCFKSGAFEEETKAIHGKLLELRAMPITDDSGKVVSVIETVRDISEQKRLEAQLRQAQKMESIGTLAGGIAHDFNNVLTAITGYGYIVQSNMDPDDPQWQNVEHMLEGVDRAAQLTKDLLIFSRKRIGEKMPVDLIEIVRKVEKFLVRVIGEDIDFSMSLPSEPSVVYADPHQLEQVLMNLATNARDAMGKGGELLISAEQITLGDDYVNIHGYGKPGNYALLTISDTGEGMDEETLRKIFDPFFTTKEVGKGTGLGLSVVYGIVKQHEGFIDVLSEPGSGTSFNIYLPLISAEVRIKEITHEEKTCTLGTETILLVEDDETVRVLISTLLNNEGYNVIEAIDGADAVIKFMENREKIHLLLSDLIMPKLNGKDAYNDMKVWRPDLKAIFVSGYAPDIVQQNMPLENGVELIYKPILPNALLEKVRIVLNEGEQQDQNGR